MSEPRRRRGRPQESGSRGAPTHDFIYGQNAVAEARRAGRRRIHRILGADDASPVELERLCGSPDHQGIVAEADRYPYVGESEIAPGAQGALTLVLDEVQDPRNLGAICRSAEVAGATGVVICERRAAGVTPAACKASAGAVEHLRIARARNLADFLESAKAAGAWIFGAEAAAEVLYDEADLTGPVVLVLGGEGPGLRPRVRETCDALVSIPVRGRIDSLNVASAASVVLFEALRQRRCTPS